MIPVTSFAGKTRRCVRPRRLGACELPRAEGGRRRGDRLATTMPTASPRPRRPAFVTADLRNALLGEFRRAVLTPGVPLTHPAPHWSVLMAREAGVEVIGDVELFCRERRRHAPDAPFVAITGTNGKSTTTALIAHLMKAAGYDTQMGGNIGTAILSLEPPRTGRVHVDRDVVLPDRPCALARSRRSASCSTSREDHIDRHGTLEHYAAVKERLVAGVQANGTAVVGVDDSWCAQHRRPARPGRQARRAHLRAKSAARRHLCRAWNHRAGLRRRRAARSRSSAASVRCAASTMRRTRPAPRPARWRWARSRRDILQNGLRSFPGLAHRMEQVGRTRQRAVRQRFQGHQCRRRRACAVVLRRYLLDRRRQAEGRRHRRLADFFPRIRKAYLIGEAAPGIRENAGRPRDARDFRDARCRGRQRRARCGRHLASPIPWCCCRRPAPRSTSTAISRSAARSSATS